jgi:SAM-dependent methyltransferase
MTALHAQSKTPTPYSPEYYDAIVAGSRASAAVIAPIVTQLVRPRSVIDIGCGTGAWLAAFAAQGAERITGVDGDYVDRDRLLIPRESFHAADLRRDWPTLDRADLAICLEVAEHVAPSASEELIANLTRLAPIILFSAAIPYQGGEDHVNERWPTFWFDLFQARGYHLVDPIRKRVWSDRRVEPWYQQNMVMYATAEAIAASPLLAREHEQTFPGFLSIVHPRIYGPVLEKAGVKPPGPWQPAGESRSA